ncbi:hypothetical protein CVT24_006641 [Panaeolus cyanescens]|uniref:DUF6699 domain-containing protein n=1 Tax=Panaeolus cyanescens TaxID=181874 RepID=A0A409YSC4_9AGAR|nr:hypothetical protein CVT24_006641 [Panaeolus cyanescens]
MSVPWHNYYSPPPAGWGYGPPQAAPGVPPNAPFIPGPGYGPYAHPGGWFPPSAHSPTFGHLPHPPQPGPAQAASTQPVSSRYPNINPALAADTTLMRFDVGIKPSQTILAGSFFQQRHSPVFKSKTTHMRILSAQFPWQIDIMISPEDEMTCEHVWNALYNALQQPLADSEWGFIVQDSKRLELVKNAIKKRTDGNAKADKTPKRIDYLGDATLFRGLEKDDEFAKTRLLPGAPPCKETWMVKLIS